MTKTISNRYLLVKKIGSGGMSDVYLAMDTVLNREVAIKLLRGDLSHDPVALLRFQREASAVSGLSHPNIVEVYDVGEDDGVHYIVMEMVRGTTLKELIYRREAVDPVEAVSIMKQLTSAMELAHHEHVIHRDIKPQNILMKDDGTAKITDFGIALAGDAIQLTKHDSVLGSVHYMAPELSRGEGASYQSDIYALGVVFYELLSGTVPYKGDSPVEVAMKHLRDPFPRIQKFNGSIPNSIANIISKSTEKNLDYRYQTIDELMEDLNHCFDEDIINEPLWKPAVNQSQDLTIVMDRVREDEPVKKKDNKKKIIAIASVVLVIAVAIVMMFVFKPENKQIIVPSMVEKKVEAARTELTELGLNVDPTVNYEYSDDYEEDLVIATVPAEGAILHKGDKIKLVVSQGKTFEIQDYVGKKIEDVRESLKGLKLDIKVINEQTADKAPGIILKQEGLNKGDKVTPESKDTLTLTVSAPMEISGVIPNVINMSVAEAQQKFIDMGMQVRTEELSQIGMSDSQIAALKYDVVDRVSPSVGSYYIQENSNYITLYYYKKIPVVEEEKPTKPDENNGQKPDEKPQDNVNTSVKPQTGETSNRETRDNL